MKTTDPLAQLERSHRRLEEACDALAVAAVDHDMETVADVAAFFGRQVRRHEEDEEKSLFPRLEAAASSHERAREGEDALIVLLARLRDEHRLHETLHARLEAAASGRGTGDDAWLEIGSIAEDLARAYREHLEQEEATLFPAARRLLTPAELDAIVDEMKERRA